MRFGLRLIEYLGPVPELVRLAVAGEKAGFDSVWFPHDTFMRHTWVTTSAVATATERIEIGSVGTNPYTTHPLELATYAATLDELSGGRFILGMGLHTLDMIGWAGVDGSDYLQRHREAVHLIRGLWRGEVMEYGGEVYQWGPECYMRFKPLRPNIPIYLSAFGEDFLRLSGEIGDGSLPMITPPASARQMVTPIREGLAKRSDQPEAYVVSGCGWLSLSKEKAAASEVMKNLAAYFGPYLEDHALQTIGLKASDFAPLRKLVDAGRMEEAHRLVTPDMLRLGISGTPEDIIAQIEQLAEAGVNEVNLGGPLGPDPEEAIRLMGEEVIPAFRD